jgi:Zn-dependent M28 family amino/carboxypeptidase
VIIFNEGQVGRTDLIAGTLGTPKTIPVVGASFLNGAALYSDTQAGNVTARVATSTESENRQTQNIIADSPKGKIKGQTIVVGAHLDSVTAGPGINDNGSGSATILEIAEQLAASKYIKKLQRQVRFAFWGAEEFNLLGSQYYVDHLTTAQIEKIYANLNFDMLGSPNYARFVYDGDGSDTPDAGPPGSDAIEDISRTTSTARSSHRSQPRSMAGPTTGLSLRKAFRRAGFSAVLRASRLPRKPVCTAAPLVWRMTSATTRRATRSPISTARRCRSWVTRRLTPR